MKTKSRFHVLSIVWGVIVILFMLLSIGSMMVIGIIEDSGKFLKELPGAFANPQDPTLYFLLFIVGYIVIWWKPFRGSIIIIASSIFYLSVAGLDGPPIFATPGFLVGALYLINWFIDRKKID